MPANVMIARQFFPSLHLLAASEQARVDQFIHTFGANPRQPGLSLERVLRARSPGVWAARAARGLRVILFKDGDTWTILHVDHHEKAYEWAARHDIGRHSITGALQLVIPVEVSREKVVELEQARRPFLYEAHSDAYLLSLGVPEPWLPEVRRLRDDQRLLDVCVNLPADVADRLMDLSVGKIVVPPQPIGPDRPATEAADARDFYVVNDAADLSAALAAPLERWITFLHASQLALIQHEFHGPAKVTGSAGTGKTVVAMHRARHLARRGERVLLTTVASTLSENIRRNMTLLCRGLPVEAVTVSTVYQQALALVRRVDPEVSLASSHEIDQLLGALSSRHAPGYEARFVRAEWDRVIRPQGVESWDDYQHARRPGRSRSLSTAQRKVLWKVFGGVIDELERRHKLDAIGMAVRAETLLAKGTVQSTYTAVIVDEFHDFSAPELLLARALCAGHPGHLMLCGDPGQRVFPGGLSLAALGIDVRGRSTVLKINYRTTEQIRREADQLLGPTTDDLDGGQEPRAGVRSLHRGPPPVLRGHDSDDEQLAAAVAQIRGWLDAGPQAAGIGVLTPIQPRLEIIGRALAAAGIPTCPIGGQHEGSRVQLGTIHQARGLELQRVLVLDCGARVIPDPAALAAALDREDREALLASERRLLYVAMTRARDELVMAWNGSPSPCLEPLLKAKAINSRARAAGSPGPQVSGGARRA